MSVERPSIEYLNTQREYLFEQLREAVKYGEDQEGISTLLRGLNLNSHYEVYISPDITTLL